MKLTIHGAARTVTGSQHLLEINGRRILLECGLFQGRRKEANEINRHFPFDAIGGVATGMGVVLACCGVIDRVTKIHQTPDRIHIEACRPWLVAEFRFLRPELVVVLGATAAKALLGPSFRVTRSRGQLMPWPGSAQRPEDFPVDEIQALATIHPSAVLRADDRDAAYGGLVDDLKVARGAVSA